MKKNDGRIKKGERRSRATEFQPGQHWRPPREHWEKEWLEREYLENGRSAAEIAEQQGITENAILFWLHKHDIPVRTVSEARGKKHWGSSGSDNPMFGRTGVLNVNWRGGVTPERQACYSSISWAECVKSVWERDGGRCQRCRQIGRRGHRMHIHHLKRFEECTAEEKCDSNMTLLLCCKCHGWVHGKHNTGGDFFLEGGATND